MTYERTDDYYDCTVPRWASYYADGILHHNTGKTTLAGAIANEVGAKLTVLYGVNLRNRDDLVPTLLTMLSMPVLKMAGTGGSGGVNVKPIGHVLMIDEIHRMWQPVQELLYPVMEDGVIDYGGGVRLKLAPIMVIGATTDPTRLLNPMLDRFGSILKLRLYTVDELVTISTRAAVVLGVKLSGDAAAAIAGAAAGVPRVALKLTKAARDYAVKGVVSVDAVTWLLSQKVLLWRLDGRDAGG